MKAKSARLVVDKTSLPKDVGSVKPRRKTVRLPKEERKQQILTKAYEFFSEYGLTAQTRALAESCGVSQRLLYSIFPNKAALLAAVYEAEISGPIKAVWFEMLKDRKIPVEARLIGFYKDYYAVILTRRWLRFFLYTSLAEESIAPKYIQLIVAQLVELIVKEVAHEKGLSLKGSDTALIQEVGWSLHGAVSHLAIRRLIYGDTRPVEVGSVIEVQVKIFVNGLSAVFEKKKNQ